MMPQIDMLSITNFRSIRGTVNIPLNAPIILVHGLNGAGKTSLLSALELAMTGDIAAMRRDDPQFAKHLVHHNQDSAVIRFSSQQPGIELPATYIDHHGIRPAPLLEPDDRKFFAERCYLAQSVLGRLLEIYSRSDSNKDNALTQFVKDLLRLDELDALINGLYDAGHLTRAKNLVPLLRQADELRKRFRGTKESATQQLRDLRKAETEQLHSLDQQLASVQAAINKSDADDLTQLRTILAVANEEAALVTALERRRELNGIVQALGDLPKDADALERDRLESEYNAAKTAASDWKATAGAELDRIIATARNSFSDLVSWTATDPTTAWADAHTRIQNDIGRLESQISKEKGLEAEIERITAELNRANARLKIANDQIATVASESGDLARALAQIVPHIHGDDCPVCGRDFRETERGTLQDHVQRKVASLTHAAGRLSSLSLERSTSENAVAVLSRELDRIAGSRVPGEALLSAQNRVSFLTPLRKQFDEIEQRVSEGASLLRREAELLGRLGGLRDRDRRVNDLRVALRSIGGRLAVAPSADDPIAAIEAFRKAIDTAEAQADAQRNARVTALESCEKVIRLRGEIETLRSVEEKAQAAFEVADTAFRKAEDLRADARAVEGAANSVRTAIVVRVFNDALNRLWRDLFVRLAPTEPFVPAFHLPETAQGIIAQLETRTRRGEKGGTPGTMLSAGNLNTAALTLFLALHLSVEARLPWLILDDPVQSMDEVHISQFAALLRTLSKTHDRKIIIAVHERALFEYLRLELSPAFADDRLITVELKRSASEETIADTNILPYEGADIIAA